MSRIEEHPGRIAAPDGTAKGGRAGLARWMDDYRSSVGASADGCATLLDDLLKSRALKSAGADALLELLEILESLSADPVTVSCAMLHVAGQQREIDSEMIAGQPRPVRLQLEELNKRLAVKQQKIILAMMLKNIFDKTL